MKIYNKLVRDKIPEIIKKNGKTPITKIYSVNKYKKALNTKLKEEVAEYLESDSIEEIADIEEVIRSILKLNKISENSLNKIRLIKNKKRGGFDKRIKLIRIED